MNKNLEKWYSLLPNTTKNQISQIQKSLDEIEKSGEIIYPSKENRFKALEITSPENIKVVIIGQDPYHGENQATGLSFSVKPGVTIPPSLKNIYKELENDLNIKQPITGDLSSWANQGVLLLNSILSVSKDKPASHKDLGWQDVTKEIIKQTTLLPNPIVYLLWGKYAIHVMDEVNKELISEQRIVENKIALTSTHPSPFSANKPTKTTKAFMGSKPFSKTNNFLQNNNQTPIDWKI